MSKPNPFLTLFRRHYTQHHVIPSTPCPRPSLRPQCLRQFHHHHHHHHQLSRPSPSPPRTQTPRAIILQSRKYSDLPPGFVSILDRPAKMVRSGRNHGPGLIILAIIPITAFLLGCWQVQRLGWKTELVARFEDRLTFPPLELPLRIDPAMLDAFDYRRVYARGRLRHDLEMLIGPRVLDGEEGFTVVTPLEREDSRGNKHRILCCRGWIKKDAKAQWFRRTTGALPEGEVMIEGLLRIPPMGNMFTPKNEPEQGKWFFPNVKEMSEWSGSQPVWVEETMTPDLLTNYEREPKGIPIGRAPTVNLRNNHTQYIFTWYALSLATSVMFWMVVKKPMSGTQRRVRHSSEW